MSSPEEDQEQRLERMAAGREANALLGILRPYIDDRLSILVQKLAAEYRNRTAEYPVLLGTAAQIAGLLDLLSDLESTSNRGNISAAKELGNGPDSR